MDTPRPAPWYSPEETPAGYHFEAVAEDDGWLPAQPDRRCSAKLCNGLAVAQMRRWVNPPGRGYAYLSVADRVARWEQRCADHLYGRWIENGQVTHWRLVADATAEVQR